jgi:hypothetical protein
VSGESRHRLASIPDANLLGSFFRSLASGSQAPTRTGSIQRRTSRPGLRPFRVKGWSGILANLTGVLSTYGHGVTLHVWSRQVGRTTMEFAGLYLLGCTLTICDHTLLRGNLIGEGTP